MNNTDILEQISSQYYDLVNIIFNFVPMSIKRQWNKKYHSECTTENPVRLYTFMRAIIREDHYFTFDCYLKKKYFQWNKPRPWFYKNMKFPNYIEFIRYFCQKNNSGKCQQKLLLFEGELKPNNKKKYKKIKVRNIRWNN
jgi:hypothetical protein